MRDKIFAQLARGSITAKQPIYDKPLHFNPITEDGQREIDFCLNCTKDTCRGMCDEFKQFSKQLKQKRAKMEGR